MSAEVGFLILLLILLNESRSSMCPAFFNFLPCAQIEPFHFGFACNLRRINNISIKIHMIGNNN